MGWSVGSSGAAQGLHVGGEPLCNTVVTRSGKAQCCRRWETCGSLSRGTASAPSDGKGDGPSCSYLVREARAGALAPEEVGPAAQSPPRPPACPGPQAVMCP